MDPTSDWYIGFVDGASRWSPNLTSTAWVIYSPSYEFIHIDGACMGSATNNQDEYYGVNGLLAIALQLVILHLNVFLDSQLLVSQLNNYYQDMIPPSLENSCALNRWLEHLNPSHSHMLS